MDEVHFQQYGSRCRMWVPPETKDPVLLHYPTRRRVGYFGAVRLRDGKFFFRRETDKFNAVTCWKFLQHLQAASTRTGRRVVVIIDNAKYHHARLHREWREGHADRFALDYLPAYSPELNPIERVWCFLKEHHLSNRVYADYDDLLAAGSAAWNARTPQRIRSICRTGWIERKE